MEGHVYKRDISYRRTCHFSPQFLLMFISCFDYIIFKNYYIIALCCTMLHYLFNILLSMIHPVQQSCLEYLSMHWLLLSSSNIQ